MHPTLIRKMTTTAVHEKEPTQKRSVATMNHDVRTAERDDFLQENRKK